MKLSILIVNWNTRDLLERCLLAVQDSIQDLEAEVIVVDNGSTDHSASLVRERFPTVTLIANDLNLGFAAANNQAYTRSTGEYILVLNSDVILTPEALAALLRTIQEKVELAGVTPRLINPDGSTQHGYHRRRASGWRLLAAFAHNGHLWRNNSLAQDYFMLNNELNTEQTIEQPAASCLLLRRSAVQEAGGLFDAVRFPIHFNDADLAERLWQHGRYTQLVSTASVVHDGGTSVDRLDPYLLKELYLVSLVNYVRRHRPFEEYILVKGLLSVATLGMVILTLTGLLHHYFTSPITNRDESVRRQWHNFLALLRERLPAGWAHPEHDLAK